MLPLPGSPSFLASAMDAIGLGTGRPGAFAFGREGSGGAPATLLATDEPGGGTRVSLRLRLAGGSGLVGDIEFGERLPPGRVHERCD